MDPQLRGLQKKRTANFREDETKLLIQLWGSSTIQNKLFLTHRKAPVMRLLAASMQQHGFYRTPDEIKTRIRNLKCLYHRIKRTLASGAGVGTVDPDWPHYKAMDNILSKEYPRKAVMEETERLLEGPKVEDIKHEIEDIDIHDDMESWVTNESVGSEIDEDEHPLPVSKPPPTLKPAPLASLKQATNRDQLKSLQPKPMPIITPGFSLHSQTNNSITTTTQARPGAVPSMVPLLILNGLPQNNANNDKRDMNSSSSSNNDGEISKVLGQILEIQKENLIIQKEKLEIKKQKLEFDRLVASHMVQLVPILSTFLQVFSKENKKKRKHSIDEDDEDDDDEDMHRGDKILRTTLGKGIKKYVLEEDKDDDSDLEMDSGIQNDDVSVTSDK